MTETDELLAELRDRRGFLLHTVRGISDADASRRSTASELCLGGLIKHVSTSEESWMRFASHGPPRSDGQTVSEPTVSDWSAQFQLLPGETLAGELARYHEVARRTDELLAGLDLDTAHELPTAPWFEPGASWTVRRVVLHLIGETAQHAGHADIIRESIDGQQTMA